MVSWSLIFEIFRASVFAQHKRIYETDMSKIV